MMDYAYIRIRMSLTPRRQDAKFGIEFHLCAFAPLREIFRLDGKIL
jgi:hypothetical protein